MKPGRRTNGQKSVVTLPPPTLAKNHDNYYFLDVENDVTRVTDVGSLDPVAGYALPNRTPNVVFIWSTLLSLVFHLLS